jgi:hypothetical protein
MRMRTLCLAAFLALAACHPSVPEQATDAGVPDQPIDAAPDATPPVKPPSTAMDTMSAAGHLTAGAYTLDVQLGGMTRSSATAADYGLDSNPVLH